MTRLVQCKKYQKELPGLTAAPFPGPRGQDIYDNVSAQAWQDWMAHQTRLINEKHLKLMDPNTRKYLQEQMDKFLTNAEIDAVEGYIPEEK